MVLLALAGAYFYGYPFAFPGRPVPAAGAAGTTGTSPNGGIDTTKAPEPSPIPAEARDPLPCLRS